MMKIGLIDYYLDEWHANNYPKMIEELSKGACQVSCAYGKIDAPCGARSNRQWAQDMGIPLLERVEDVIENSDRLMVLSPDHPEMHEELCALPLKSGKPTYVDKTFAPDKGTAERIFAHAEAHGTKCYSSSALRFAQELKTMDQKSICKLYMEGPGNYDMYAIHQIEPIVALMNSRARRVMFTGESDQVAMVIQFEDGRYAQFYQTAVSPFRITVDAGSGAGGGVYPIKSDYFRLFLAEVLRFFQTGHIPVPWEQTIEVIAIREAGQKARKAPFQWVSVP